MVFSLNQMLNVSPNLQIAIFLENLSSLPYFFLNDVEEHEFPLNCTKSFLKRRDIFSLQSPEFTAAYSLKSEKGWPVDFAKL